MPYRKSRKIQKTLRTWGQRVWGGVFSCNYYKRLAQELRRIILLHFGLVSFRIHSGKTLKPFIFMILGPRGLDHDPQNQVFLILETPRYGNESQENPKSFKNMFFWKSQQSGNRPFGNLENSEDPCNTF